MNKSCFQETQTKPIVVLFGCMPQVIFGGTCSKQSYVYILPNESSKRDSQTHVYIKKGSCVHEKNEDNKEDRCRLKNFGLVRNRGTEHAHTARCEL